MKQKLINWLCKQNKVYNFTIKLIANRIIRENTVLTPQYLIDKGWIFEDGYYTEPNIKLKYKLWIRFEHHYYYVFYGENKTPITLESSLEWFQMFYLLIHKDNGLFKLAGI